MLDAGVFVVGFALVAFMWNLSRTNDVMKEVIFCQSESGRDVLRCIRQLFYWQKVREDYRREQSLPTAVYILPPLLGCS